jgi:hypothetical protein
VITIASSFCLGNQVVQPFSDEMVKNEPMLWRTTVANAKNSLGGPLTKAFIEALPDEWRADPNRTIIDSRSHMLMKGWYPAIPGFHHDDVVRSLSTGQPNYVNPAYRPDHVMMLVNADVCPTEFAVGTMDFEIPPPEAKTYQVWHPLVTEAVKDGRLKSVSTPDRTLIFFDDRTWHQAIPAQKRGWRWFIRATRNTQLLPRNEVRKQVQVYLENPMEGW